MTRRYDAVVIGAGALGLAAARDLGRGGKSVLVLEQEQEIGAGLSSHTSRCAHAGAKFGNLASWAIVPAMAKECRRLVDWAPQHLKAVRNFVPYSSFSKPRAAVNAWMRVYDRLRGDRAEWQTELNVEAPSSLKSLLKNPHEHGVMYQDFVFDDVALTARAFNEAVALGCIVLTGAKVWRSTADNGSWTVCYTTDAKPYEAVTRTVVNAAGLSVDQLLSAFGFAPSPRPELTRATHIWVKAPHLLDVNWSLRDPATGLGLLIMPDGPRTWMIGCTDSADPGSREDLLRDVDQLLDAVGGALREPLDRNSVERVRSGFRPRPPARSSSDVARNRQYVLRRDASPCGAGLVSILYGRLEWMNRIGSHVAHLT